MGNHLLPALLLVLKYDHQSAKLPTKSRYEGDYSYPLPMRILGQVAPVATFDSPSATNTKA